MGKVFLLVACSVIALLYWRASYCGTIQVTSASAEMGQQEVLRQLLNERKNCLCPEIRVEYTFVDHPGFIKPHMAYFRPSEKTLRIETDLGSGWAFGWDNVDVDLIERVLRKGGQFSLFTKYRPNSTNPPRPQYQQDPPY